MDEVASSEFEQRPRSCSALPDHVVIAGVSSMAEDPDWHVIMVGVTMVGDSSSNAFTRDELLAECLAGCAVLGTAAPAACFDSSLVLLLVVKSRAGIFECMVTSTTEVQ